MALAALEGVPLQGNLFHAGQLRALAPAHGPAATPFLLRALETGSAPIRATAMQVLGLIAPVAATERALMLVASDSAPRDDSELRANAAEVLARVPAEQALSALLRAAHDQSPLVAEAALEALKCHSGSSATTRMHHELRRLVHESSLANFAAKTTSQRGRALRAAQARLVVVARRSFRDAEVDLFTWWRRHPDVSVQVGAAQALLRGGSRTRAPSSPRASRAPTRERGVAQASATVRRGR